LAEPRKGAQPIPVTGIDKKIWFKAQKPVDLKAIVLKRVILNSPRSSLEELNHCRNPNAVQRRNHERNETLMAKQRKDLFSVCVYCVGLHGKEFSSMIVVIEAQTKNNAKEKLRSEPFVLCPGRSEPALKEAYEQMKFELNAASCFLSQATESSTPAIPAPVLTSQFHQEDLRANPPPTTPFHELALSPPTGDLFDNIVHDEYEWLSRWDFTRSRFVN